jgi:hypothetical protein
MLDEVKSQKLKVKSVRMRASIAFLSLCTFNFLLLTFNFASASGDPSTSPSTSPVETQARIAQCIETLANPEPQLRAGAREALLASGSREDLKLFRKVIAGIGPLVPNQVAALREIVEHLFLTGETYEKNPDAGFLGVQLRSISVQWSPQGGVPGTLQGCEIVERYPGFCGYASLQNGDVVLQLGQHGQALLPALDMSGIVRLMHPGTTIDMQVLRQGRLIIVPIVINARPTALDDPAIGVETMRTFLAGRQTAADRFWETTFAPLTGRKPS